MKPADEIKKFFKNASLSTNPEIDQTVLDKVLNACEKTTNIKSAAGGSNIWRMILNSRISKFAAAAVIIIAVIVGISQLGGSVSAANVAFAGVIEDVSNTPWLHLTLHVNRAEDDYDYECWFSIKRGIFAGRLDSIIVWRNYFDHQERIYVPATNKLYIRYFKKDLSQEDQPVLNYLKMLFSKEIANDATIIKRVKDFEGEQMNEFKLMKKEDGVTTYFRLLTDPDTNILKSLEAEVKNANAERILYLEGQGNYLYKGPSNIYDLGVPTNTDILNQSPTLEAKELLDTCKMYRGNFSSYIVAVMMGQPTSFGVAIEIDYVQGDMSKAGRYFKYLNYFYANLEIDRELLEKKFEEDFDSSLDSIKSEDKYKSLSIGLWDGKNRYLITPHQKPLLRKGKGIGAIRDIGGYAWPISLPTGKIIDDEYSKENNLICLRTFGQQLYFDPEHDYICVRRCFGPSSTDGHISLKAEDEISTRNYEGSERIVEVTELAQTNNGLWYPRRIEGISIQRNAQGDEISREVTYTDTIYIKMVSDFPTGTFDPDKLPKVIE
ncbi:MAG: hypothetical protein ACYS1A_07450 [Planctomycetota bacterium]|jgi:hypothetical protein